MNSHWASSYSTCFSHSGKHIWVQVRACGMGIISNGWQITYDTPPSQGIIRLEPLLSAHRHQHWFDHELVELQHSPGRWWDRGLSFVFLPLPSLMILLQESIFPSIYAYQSYPSGKATVVWTRSHPPHALYTHQHTHTPMQERSFIGPKQESFPGGSR